MKAPKQKPADPGSSRSAKQVGQQDRPSSAVRYLSYIEAMIRFSSQSREAAQLTPLPILQ